MKKIYLFVFVLAIFQTAVFAQTTATVISQNANLRGTPSERGKVVEVLPQNSFVEVISQRGAWFLVQSTEYAGWLHGNTIRLTSPLTVNENYSVPEPRTTTRRPSTNTRRNSESRTYIRGPRGGCYYINSNGNKTYVSRSLCN